MAAVSRGVFDSGAAIDRSNQQFLVTAKNSNTLWGSMSSAAICSKVIRSPWTNPAKYFGG